MSAAHVLVGARVIDPGTGRDEIADVVIGEDGTILEVGPGLELQVDRSVPRTPLGGLLLCPGFVDVHTHLREPGQEYKETIATGAAAAVAGGFSTILCMANTRPVNDNATVTRFIRERAAQAGLARVLPVGAVSRGLEGLELAEIGEMIEAGAAAISDDGRPIMDAHLMRRALEYSRIFGLAVSVHEEDNCLAGGGCMNEGPVATVLGLPGIPNAAEDVMVARDLELLELAGGRLHIAHLSTRAAVRLVRDAKHRGLSVTAEVTPHHFTLTDEAVRGYDPNTKMAPPLRAELDRLAVIEGLADGTIDAVATDHAPHATVEKEQEFELCANGVIGLETAWALGYRLVESGTLSLRRLVEALTTGPCGAFGLPYGTLRRGASADLCAIDLGAHTPVELRRIRSRSKNTPFLGWTLPTQVVGTWVGGVRKFEGSGER